MSSQPIQNDPQKQQQEQQKQQQQREQEQQQDDGKGRNAADAQRDPSRQEDGSST